MRTLLYRGNHHEGGAPEDAESRALQALLRHCFLKTRGPCPLVWLFTEAATGCGFALACGRFTLKPGARSQLYKKGVGVYPVPAALHQTLLDFGPTALRWNGTALVVDGN